MNLPEGYTQDTVRVYYTCACGLTDVRVRVPRRSAQTDIQLWVDMMAERVGIDHGHRAPGCRLLTMTNVKLPAPEEGIGMDDWGGTTPPWDDGSEQTGGFH